MEHHIYNNELNYALELSKQQASLELDRLPVFETRQVRLGDVDKLVELDMYGFQSVYEEYDADPDQIREDLREKFEQRIHRVGADWIRVAEQDGEICGFMMSCPTTKRPEDFVSWEDTTDNGTLESTYDPDGPNLYVVSLTAPRPAVASGETPRNMLIVDHIGKMVEHGLENAFFESRMPGLRDWVKQHCEHQGIDFENIAEDALTDLANEYATTYIENDGKKVLLDKHLRMYASIGCKFMKVAPNAYQDGPSLNYGIVATYENPLPQKIRHVKPLQLAVGGVVRAIGRSHRATRRFFK